MRAQKNQRVAYTLGGLSHVTLVGITRMVCPNGHDSLVIPKIAQLHDLIARLLIQKPSTLADSEVRWLRKYLGFDQATFAKRMGVTPETVSRWETGAVVMAPTAERLLRFMAASIEPVKDYQLLDRLASIQTTREPARMKLRNDGATWTAA
jgi:DNA-binding transcriptional regulator YiaG